MSAARRPIECIAFGSGRRTRSLNVRGTHFDRRLLRAAASRVGPCGISTAAYIRATLRIEATRSVLLGFRSKPLPLRRGFELWQATDETFGSLTFRQRTRREDPRAYVEAFAFAQDPARFHSGVAAIVTFPGDPNLYLVDVEAVRGVLRAAPRPKIAVKADRKAANVRPRGAGGLFVSRGDRPTSLYEAPRELLERGEAVLPSQPTSPAPAVVEPPAVVPSSTAEPVDAPLCGRPQHVGAAVVRGPAAWDEPRCSACVEEAERDARRAREQPRRAGAS